MRCVSCAGAGHAGGDGVCTGQSESSKQRPAYRGGLSQGGQAGGAGWPGRKGGHYSSWSDVGWYRELPEVVMLQRNSSGGAGVRATVEGFSANERG